MKVVVRTGAWLILLGLVLVQLHDLDLDPAPHQLAAPTGPDAAAGLVMEVVRLVALGLGWYLVAATISTLLVGLAGATGPARLVPRRVQRALRQLCGLTVALSVATPGLAAGAETGSAITMQRLADEPVTEDAAAITMRRLDRPATVAPPSIADPAPPAPAPSEPSSHVIVRGEHLWAVAESTLASSWGAAPTDAEVDPYWRELIRRNRSRLPDPANPDLVHPGLELEVPPVPAHDV